MFSKKEGKNFRFLRYSFFLQKPKLAKKKPFPAHINSLFSEEKEEVTFFVFSTLLKAVAEQNACFMFKNARQKYYYSTKKFYSLLALKKGKDCLRFFFGKKLSADFSFFFFRKKKKSNFFKKLKSGRKVYFGMRSNFRSIIKSQN